MAFVSRADRDFTVKKDEDGVGPGSYISNSSFGKKLHSYAPFSSMTERSGIAGPTGKKNKAEAPGPGFYLPAQGFDKIQKDVKNMRTIQKQGLDKFGISILRPSNTFASKVDRFQKKKVDAGRRAQERSPEPGHYSLKEDWAKGGTIKMAKSQSHKVLKKPQNNPPSIPSHNNVFGYEYQEGRFI